MVLWVADYLINFISYYIAYRWVISVPFRKNILFHVGVALASCPLVIVLCQSYVFGFDRYVLSAVALLTLIIIFKREHIIRVLLIFPIMFFALGSLSIVFTYVLSFATGVPYREFIDSKWFGVLSEAVFPAVFIVIYIFIKRVREERETVVFNVPQYLIALLGSLCLFFIIAVSQGVMEGKADFSSFSRPLAFVLPVVGILFVVLILWQSRIEKKVMRYKMDNEYYQLCLKRQETHIREIVENDQKIRRFRHDVNAHLTAIEQCVKTNDLQQLKSYVERMRAETRKLEVQKFTGIGVVDAIISEWYLKAKDENIRWEWEGGLLGKTEMEAFDLCVIFSNLLSNAVEAAEQVEADRERKITVSCGAFRDRICIRVSNTCRDNTETKLRHGTTKSDYQNHGFGLMNIRNTVAKVNGEFNTSVERGIFNAEIIL